MITRFLQKKYTPFIIGLLVLLFAVFFSLKSSLKKELKEETGIEIPKIEIDFSVLESPAVEELKPFEKIKAFEGELGRENPFLPY